MNEPIQYLKFYAYRYGTVKVALCMNNASGSEYWKYFQYPSEEFTEFFKYAHSTQPGHREIFKDELVIEGDLPDRKLNLENSHWIGKRLAKLGFAYAKYFSGNKSYHFHTFFPELQDKTPEESVLIKERLLRYIFECQSASLRCRTCSVETCKLREMGVDLQLTSKHLIRIEYGIHQKTDRRKILVQEHNVKHNGIPAQCLAKAKNVGTYVPGKFKPVYSKMPCINFLQTPEAFEKRVDARERILFVLTSKYKLSGLSQIQTIAAMKAWNETALKGYFIDEKINSTIYSVYGSNQNPGCPYMKSILKDLHKLEVCDGCSKRAT